MKYAVILVISLALLASCAHGTKPTLTVQKEEVLIHNWHPENLDNTTAAVYLWNASQEKVGTTKVGGSFRYVKGEGVAFSPDFPLLENTAYVLVMEAGGVKMQHRFSLAKEGIEPLGIMAVYPSADTLPENLLRMYVTFSQPMKTTGNLEHIRLLNGEGQAIEGAIFNNVYELWDPTQTQLTLIFDPARVKTDLVANKELGRALSPGKTFQIAIDSVEDIYGQRLATPFVKTFVVAEQDVTAPSISAWEVFAPQGKRKAGLIIDFPAAVDRMSLLTRIGVFNDKGQAIRGSISIGEQETQWQFIPQEPWAPGQYALMVNTRLADPAGNNLNGLFDHKLGSLKNEREGEIITLPFTIE